MRTRMAGPPSLMTKATSAICTGAVVRPHLVPSSRVWEEEEEEEEKEASSRWHVLFVVSIPCSSLSKQYILFPVPDRCAHSNVRYDFPAVRVLSATCETKRPWRLCRWLCLRPVRVFTATRGTKLDHDVFASGTAQFFWSPSWWRCRFQGVTSDSEQTGMPASGQLLASIAIVTQSSWSSQVCSQQRAVRSRTWRPCCFYDTESGTDYWAGQCGLQFFSPPQVHLIARGPSEQATWCLLQRTTVRSATPRTLVSMASGWITPSRLAKKE